MGALGAANPETDDNDFFMTGVPHSGGSCWDKRLFLIILRLLWDWFF